MFTSRQLTILSLLLSENDWIRGSKLAEYLYVSSKTIQKEIKNINAILGKNGLIQSNNQKGYYLVTLNDSIKSNIMQNKRKDLEADFILGRTKNIAVLLLFEKKYISMGKIAERIYQSKATINSDIPKVRRAINRRKGMYLEISASNGIFIHADESVKRHFLTQAMDKTVNYTILLKDPSFAEFDLMLEQVRLILKDIFLRYDFIITGLGLQQFVIYIVISILRSQKGFIMENQVEHGTVLAMAIEISENIEQKFGYKMSENEIIAIDKRLHEINLLKKKLPNSLEIQGKVELFCSVVEKELQIDLKCNDSILAILIRHLEQMIIRINNRHSNINHYTNEIIQKYPLETHLSNTYFLDVFDIDIPVSEIGYLIIYLSGAVENCRVKRSILIVSDYDASLLFNMQQKMNRRCGEVVSDIHVIPIYVYESNEEIYEKDYDIIFTTERELLFRHKNHHYINPMIDEQELNDIGYYIYEFHDNKRQEIIQKLWKKYVDQATYLVCEKQYEDIESALADHHIIPDDNTCINSLHSNILYISIIDFKLKKNDIHFITFRYPITYAGKNISHLIISRFSDTEEYVIDFYDLISEVLKPGHLKQLWKKM